MIRFACKCGYVFKLADDTAGTVVQCPRCKNLRDIPTLQDLPNLAEDGTYTLGEVREKREEERLPELNRAYGEESPSAIPDEESRRLSYEQIRTGGVEAQTDEEGFTPGGPKYDPITGELLRPMELVNDDVLPAAAIPMAQAAIDYAAGGIERRVNPARVSIELLMPGNMVVMVFAFFFHIFAYMVWLVLAMALIMFGPSVIIIAAVPALFLLMGHYANTVEETGPDARDELPRPLRHLNWEDDLWGPFVRFAIAALYAYAPLLLFLPQMERVQHGQGVIAALLFTVGQIVFPAAVLTTTTSGSLLNLRPDRIVRVILQAGAWYWFAVLLWSISVVLLGLATFGLLVMPDFIEEAWKWTYYLGWFLIRLPMLMLGVYTMHFFCWFLGMIYRAHHDYFGWVLQQHIPTKLRERMAMQNAQTSRAQAQRPQTSAQTRRPTRKLWM